MRPDEHKQEASKKWKAAHKDALNEDGTYSRGGGGRGRGRGSGGGEGNGRRASNGGSLTNGNGLHGRGGRRGSGSGEVSRGNVPRNERGRKPNVGRGESIIRRHEVRPGEAGQKAEDEEDGYEEEDELTGKPKFLLAIYHIFNPPHAHQGSRLSFARRKIESHDFRFVEPGVERALTA
jgi:hypothetical protein